MASNIDNLIPSFSSSKVVSATSTLLNIGLTKLVLIFKDAILPGYISFDFNDASSSILADTPA